jgi:hypothetical protein
VLPRPVPLSRSRWKELLTLLPVELGKVSEFRQSLAHFDLATVPELLEITFVLVGNGNGYTGQSLPLSFHHAMLTGYHE